MFKSLDVGDRLNVGFNVLVLNHGYGFRVSVDGLEVSYLLTQKKVFGYGDGYKAQMKRACDKKIHPFS